MSETKKETLALADMMKTVEAWKTGQVLLPNVPRWNNYNKIKGVRLQNTLQHTHSVVFFGMWMLERMEEYLSPMFDKYFFITSLHLHDEGEGIIGEDTLYDLKTPEKDAKEYSAFAEYYKPLLERKVWEHVHAAYLLQYCTKDVSKFPKEARGIVQGLLHSKKDEALLFDLVERVDYMLYAIEQYDALKEKNPKEGLRILQEVWQVRQRSPILNLREKILGSELIWSNELTQELDEIVS